MPALRFRFRLTPLDEVRPWGNPGRLHWFGLTDGQYWIEADGDAVVGPFDYYVARLWEDLLVWAPRVLEPVPDQLVDFVAGDYDPERMFDTPESEAAAVWHGEHFLDLGYLREPPRVRAWRSTADDLDEVIVMWQRRDGESRRVRMLAESFAAAVRLSHEELLAAMAQRVGEVECRGSLAGSSLDLEALRREQDDRVAWIRQVERPLATDWGAVRAGARQLVGGVS